MTTGEPSITCSIMEAPIKCWKAIIIGQYLINSIHCVGTWNGAYRQVEQYFVYGIYRSAVLTL